MQGRPPWALLFLHPDGAVFYLLLRLGSCLARDLGYTIIMRGAICAGNGRATSLDERQSI